MLKKSARLEVSENFKWVMGGKRLETANLKLFFRSGDNPSVNSGLVLYPRIGVAVNSKEFKEAHLRVKAKRLCFEAARLSYEGLPIGINLVMMPKSSILNISIDDLVKELSNAKISN